MSNLNLYPDLIVTGPGVHKNLSKNVAVCMYIVRPLGFILWLVNSALLSG